nr:hypothetical protein [Tanacetum cinerariifolium]GEW21846.1 hypothetical protein [Tanacetum cinerariifolium]GEX27358.1 hypothetical protein [Tanacetum cinerariifolium]
MRMLVWGKLIQKHRQKGVYEESFSRHAAWIDGSTLEDFIFVIFVLVRNIPDLETPIPTAAQIGLENLIEAQALSYTIAKNVEEYEAHQKFADEMMLSQEDPDTNMDPESHKESPEAGKVVEYQSINEEKEEEENKDKLMELMASKPSSSSSKPTSNRTKHIQGAIARMRRRHGYMLQHMMKSFMSRHDMNTLSKKLEETLKEVVPKMNAKAELALMVIDAVKREQERTRPELSSQVSTGISNNVPPQIDAFIRNNMINNILHVHLTSSLSSYILDLQQQIYFKMRDDEQAQYVDFALWITLKYKYEKTSSHVEPCRIDVFADKIIKIIMTIMLVSRERAVRNYKNVQERKWKEVGSNFYDQQRMQDVVDDIIRSQCNSHKEHAYHLDQMNRYMKNKIV